MERIQATSESPLQIISINIIGVIFEFLTLKQVCRVGATCRRLLSASEMNQVWSDFPASGSSTQKKRTFLLRGNTTRNVLQGKAQLLILKGHTDMITDITNSGTKVITSSRDTNVCVWDANSSKGVRLTGHSNWVLKSYAWQDKVVSVSSDKTIRIWDGPDNCSILRGHSQGITCSDLAQEQNLLATGSHDTEIKLWDLSRARNTSSFKYFDSPVNNVSIEDNLLTCSSQDDPRVLVRDLQRGETFVELMTPRQPNGRTLTLSANETRSILMKFPILYTGGGNCVKVWDLRTPSVVGTAEVPYSLRKTLRIQGDQPRGVFDIRFSELNRCLVVGCMGLMGLVMFDLRKLRQDFYVKSHDYPILSIDMGSNVLQNLAVSSGTSTNYQYEMSVHQIASPVSSKVKLVPGHKAVITALKMTDESIFSGAKDGSVYGMCFRTRKELLRNSSTRKTLIIR